MSNHHSCCFMCQHDLCIGCVFLSSIHNKGIQFIVKLKHSNMVLGVCYDCLLDVTEGPLSTQIVSIYCTQCSNLIVDAVEECGFCFPRTC